MAFGPAMQQSDAFPRSGNSRFLPRPIADWKCGSVAKQNQGQALEELRAICARHIDALTIQRQSHVSDHVIRMNGEWALNHVCFCGGIVTKGLLAWRFKYSLCICCIQISSHGSSPRPMGFVCTLQCNANLLLRDASSHLEQTKAD